MEKNVQEGCNYCDGHGNNLDEHEDFCPECDSPSEHYKKMIYTEMEENGELSI